MTEQLDAPADRVSFLAPAPPTKAVTTPTPDAIWDLPRGTAWVFYGNEHTGLVRPVILADGFNSGPTTLEEAWTHLEGGGFATELLARGRDLIILGYAERSASILTNAEAAIAAIRRAIYERQGGARLMVGGFSMGGLVTRYALMKMECTRENHETAVYLSFDSPHRGAWIPIGLQAFAHFLAEARPLLGGALSRQINSDAARQLLWRHIATVEATPGVDDLRRDFLDRLDAMGGWPQVPLKLGIASGAGNGVGNGIPAGDDTLIVSGGDFGGTLIRAQSPGPAQLVAQLRSKDPHREIDVTTSGPALDGAPGGTLGSYGIAAYLLTNLFGSPATAPHPDVCFVPTVSAVAVADLDNADLNVDDLPAEASELDEFIVANTNQAHSAITPDLANWILDRLPE